MMPECTPQKKDNHAFRGEDFKVNSVQEIPFGFRLIRAGEQIYPSGDCVSGYGWHGFGILRNHFHLQCYSVYRRFARRGKPEFLRLPERQNAIWSAGLSR